MKKQALLALMLALTLILTGCTLVQKDPKVDAAREIIRLGDAVVTKGEVQQQIQEELSYTEYLYAMYYGQSYDTTSESNIASARDEVIENLKEELVRNAKIAELGLDQLTEEEQAEAQSTADSAFQSYLDSLVASKYADTDLSDEEKNARAKAEMEEAGYAEQALEYGRESVMNNKLRAEIVKDVTVSDEEIQKEYDSRVATAKETYENNAGSWASAANNGSTLYYTPAGVRFVKQILVKFLEEDQAKIDEAAKKAETAQSDLTGAEAKIAAAQETLDAEAASEEDKAAAETDRTAAEAEKKAAEEALAAAQKEESEAREAAFANLDSAADDILAQLDAGGDWDALMAEKNQDPGMQSGITAERGYAVSADMTSFDSAFVEAAMGLQAIGDHSGKVRGESNGYYIIRYVSDAAEGPIALDEVKETLRSSLQSSKESSTYTDTIKSWVDAAEFKIDLDALKD